MTDIFTALFRSRGKRNTLHDINRAADMIEAPIPMILHCPVCHTQHIDEPGDCVTCIGLGLTSHPKTRLDITCTDCNGTGRWNNPPHRSHTCQKPGCNTTWRPSDIATCGVATITSHGKRDNVRYDH